MRQDNPLLGILLMLGFCVVAPMGDAVAKMLGGLVPLGQLLLVRFGVQLILLAPLIFWGRRIWRANGWLLRMIVLRTVLHIVGIGMMFVALMYLPLADAIAIAFVLPFIMLVLGYFWLNEEVGQSRMVACAVGFAGTLLVVQPAFESVGWPALLPLGVALNFAVFMLVTRQIAKETDPVSLQAVSGAIALVILAPLVFLLPADLVPAMAWAPVGTDIWGLLLMLGIFGTVGHLLMTWSLRFAPSTTLAPMQYLEIPFATIIGWIVFNDLPNSTATLGILVTIAAGLFIMLKERATARSLKKARDATHPAQSAAE